MHHFLPPSPVPSLCFESLSEMQKSLYLFTLQPDLAEVFGRGSPVSSEPPSGSQDELHEMPA